MLTTFTPSKLADLRSKPNHYLKANVKDVTNAIAWWHTHHSTYSQLSCMALDYLMISSK